MIDLYDDNADVEYGCAIFKGAPVLAVQTTGPVLSGIFLGGDYKDLKARVAFDLATFPDVGAGTFLVYNGKDMHSPILACDVEPTIAPVCQALDRGISWFLVLQFHVEGQRTCRIFHVHKDRSEEMPGSPARGWLVGIQGTVG